MVFTLEGRLIGSAGNFLEEIKQKYQKIMSLPQDTLKRRSGLNVKLISEEMRKVRFRSTRKHMALLFMRKLKVLLKKPEMHTPSLCLSLLF